MEGDKAGDKALKIISQMGELTTRVKASIAKRAAFIEERSRMVAQIIEKIKQLKLKNVENSTEIKALQEQLEENKRQLEELTNDVAGRTAGGEALQKQIDALTSQLETKNTELIRVTQELEQSKEGMGMSSSEIETLKQHAKELQGELDAAKTNLTESKGQLETQTKLSEEMREKIALIESSLKNNYDELKREVEALLESVDADDAEQRKLLQSILDALDGEQRALESNSQALIVRPESIPLNQEKTKPDYVLVAPPPYNKEQQTAVDDLNGRIAKYFVKVGDKYEIQGDTEEIKRKTNELANLTPLVVPINFFNTMKKTNPDMYNKWKTYKSYGGLDVRPLLGGRRKRATQRKHRRNKKVTRKRAQRRATQKKQRPIRKRRTARK